MEDKLSVDMDYRYIVEKRIDVLAKVVEVIVDEALKNEGIDKVYYHCEADLCGRLNFELNRTELD